MKMTMTWKWRRNDKLLNQGERKRGRKRANTNTDTPGKPWKRKGKEKADGRRTKPRPEEGGGRKPDTTCKARAAWNKGVNYWCAQAPSFQRTVRDKAQRHGLSIHPDELGAQHNTSTKRKWPHPDSMSWSLKPCHVASAKGWAVSRAKLEKEVSQVQQSATLAISQVKGVEARYCGQLSNQSIDQGVRYGKKDVHTSQSAPPPPQQSNIKKWPTASLYLDELPYYKVLH